MAIRQRNLEALHSVTMLAPTTVSAANDTTAIDCSAFDGDVCLILTAPASAQLDTASLRHPLNFGRNAHENRTNPTAI